MGVSDVLKHTELADKEVARVIDHADESVVNAKIADGIIDLTKKATYVPVNKAGDTMTGDLLPDPTDAHDFGSAAKRWRNLHLGGEVYSDNTVPGRITIPSSIFGKFTDPPHRGRVRHRVRAGVHRRQGHGVLQLLRS
ncbi:unnamed protein product, partial [marine sediment metagenome]